MQSYTVVSASQAQHLECLFCLCGDACAGHYSSFSLHAFWLPEFQLACHVFTWDGLLHTFHVAPCCCLTFTSCRLWPSTQRLSPQELRPVVNATVACILKQHYNIFWALEPDAHVTRKGSWVSAQQACFLSMADIQPHPKVLEVARRAGLLLWRFQQLFFRSDPQS